MRGKPRREVRVDTRDPLLGWINRGGHVSKEDTDERGRMRPTGFKGHFHNR